MDMMDDTQGNMDEMRSRYEALKKKETDVGLGDQERDELASLRPYFEA